MRCLLAFLMCAAGAATSGAAWSAYAYEPYGELKYPAGFTHFSYVNPDAPKGGSMVLVPPWRVQTFDKFNPFTLKGTAAPGLAELMFESLLTGAADDATGGYGLLAEDVAVAPDRMSVTFRLNPAARFHNGDPVLAADVKYSFDTLISKQAAPQYRSIFEDVKAATVLGPREVRFDFAKLNLELPMVVGSMPVFSRQWGMSQGVRKPFDQIVTDTPIGSGPYRIDRSDFGRDITYRRDPNYWARQLNVRVGQFNFETITYRMYKDSTASREGLKAGEFDFFQESVSRDWARAYTGKVFERGEVVKREFPHQNVPDFQAYVFNLREPKFQDVRVRKAIALAMDFEWMNRQLFYNSYTRARGYFGGQTTPDGFGVQGLPGPDELALLEPLRAQLPPEVFGPAPEPPRTDTPEGLRGNLREAQALLKAAGWTYRDGALRNAKGEPFTMEFIDSQGPSILRLLAPYMKALEKLGIKLTYRPVDFALLLQRLQTFRFDFGSMRIPGSSSPSATALQEMFSSKAADTEGSSNQWGLKSPAVDALIAKVAQAQTRQQLRTAIRALDRVLLNGWYSVPMWYSGVFRVAYRPAKFELPPVVPPYYQPELWALSTWWGSKPNLAAVPAPNPTGAKP
ncbi:extracellular solute-binding protein [Variovorax terrae]|uniref:Extracellular solute-binding protein n=1 Tax=Variovorax terrae TaxID=2923278 RepID=A0A9X1VUL0_9BURK|nr:extracellular solute-binding protein [Variovorax terrae]MCJ0763200.1 extracellular solute-binding protein [Variovorax terrae]